MIIMSCTIALIRPFLGIRELSIAVRVRGADDNDFRVVVKSRGAFRTECARQDSVAVSTLGRLQVLGLEHTLVVAALHTRLLS